MPIPTPEERLGTRVADKYTLTRVLGRGGMGVVFEAIHLWTGRVVAIKVLLPGLADDPNVAARFLNEARAATKLKHHHVVDVLDMGRDTDGTVYLVLEWLDGEPLSALLAREGKLSIRTTLQILLPMIDALESAHRQGVLHRDVKPANIFLRRTAEGPTEPVLLDFGIAKLHDAEALTTQSGVVLGTPYYMAPEQALGVRSLGPAVDIWAVGVLLFECLSGRLPFTETSAAAYFAHLVHDDAPRLDSVMKGAPSALVEIVRRCLRREPDKRYASMQEVMTALCKLATRYDLDLAFRPTLREPAPEPVTAPARRFRSNGLLWAIAATTLLAAAAGSLRPVGEETGTTFPRAKAAQSVPKRAPATLPLAPPVHPPSTDAGNTVPEHTTTEATAPVAPAARRSFVRKPAQAAAESLPKNSDEAASPALPRDMTDEW